MLQRTANEMHTCQFFGPVFPGVSKFFIKSPHLWECLLGDFRRLFLDIVFNDILTMQTSPDFLTLRVGRYGNAAGVRRICKKSDQPK